MPPNAPVGIVNLTSTLTAEELAEKLKVTKKTIWKLTRQRRIPHFKVGRVARYDYEDVKAALLKRPRGYTVAEVGKRMLVAGQFQDGWHVGMANVRVSRYLSDAFKRVRPPTRMLAEFASTLRQETLQKLKRIRGLELTRMPARTVGQ